MPTPKTADSQNSTHSENFLATVQERVEALLDRVAEGGTPPALAAKLIAASHAGCEGHEFNVWHANADNVTGNGGDLPWGTLGREATAK